MDYQETQQEISKEDLIETILERNYGHGSDIPDCDDSCGEQCNGG